ncbi:MAG: hypothetical protein K1060chlam2_00565 [Chlamydiae bacterium]|nr:hypothetical protein [Chlamydiota bacterium]
MAKKIVLLFILSTLVGCSGLERSEQKKVRQQNLTVSPIERQEDEVFFPFPEIKVQKRASYPWESKRIGAHLRITKEFFRCRGNVLNPPIQLHKYKKLVYHLDCGGIERHSLPIKDGREFIYPILIDLLNHIQEKTGRRVLITCGHRCPAHNLYSDASKGARSSKHLIGGEVDFYVEGFEENPTAIVEVLQEYYGATFQRSNRFSNGATPSWYNKEVAITLYHSHEGRDFDNDHPYPYLSLQALFDRESRRAVRFNWHQAYNGYLKN